MNRNRSRILLCLVSATLLVGAVGLVVLREHDGRPAERPQFGLDLGPEGPEPRFVAVSDGRGGVAGYAERALLDGSGEQPASPAGALGQMNAPGIVVRVFGRDAQVVGYFASQIPGEPGGFVDEAGKDALVAKGWRYVVGTAPVPE